MFSKNNALLWIFKNTKFALWHILLLTVIGALLSACSVSFALVSKQFLDVITGDIIGDIGQKVLFIILLILAQIFLQITYSSLHIRVLGKLDISLKGNIFSGLLKKDWQSVSRYHSGELLNRLTSDINVITGAVMNIIPNFTALCVRLVMSFFVLLFLDSTFALIMICISPIVLIISRFYKKKMKHLHKMCQESDGKTRSYMQEALQNILVIKSFQAENYATAQTQKLQYTNYKYRIKRNIISIMANIGVFLTFTAGYYFALVYGAYKLSLGIITFGSLTAMLQLVGQVQTPFKGLAEILPQYYSAIASSERIMELESLPDDKTSADFNAMAAYDGLKSIDFSDITFAYDREALLEHADFSLKKGEFVCIAGISGIGKSTLLRLALGFITPSEGSISMSMKDGSTCQLSSATRLLFAYVPQGNMVLSGTIRDNIKFLYTDATDEAVIESAKIAQIWEDIQAMPQGLDTPLGEKGMGLSEGQVQRIAIARALLSNSPVLLLDEATSALDEKTEAALLNALRKTENKSCIIVSHKSAAIASCDRTVYIENKRVVDSAHTHTTK